MREIIDSIYEKTTIDKKDNLKALLKRCICTSTETSKSTYATHDNVLFKIDVYFKGLSKVLNSVKKDQKLILGIEITSLVLEEVGFELDKEDVFIFFHLRELGKFRLKESKLKEEVTKLWQQHKEYALSDRDFSLTLKVLMRTGLIDYRRGNIWLTPAKVIRYKNK